jgi:hypothetical protein
MRPRRVAEHPVTLARWTHQISVSYHVGSAAERRPSRRFVELNITSAHIADGGKNGVHVGSKIRSIAGRTFC